MKSTNGVAIRCETLHSAHGRPLFATNRAQKRAGEGGQASERVHSAHAALYSAELVAGVRR